jgi:pyruvate formate lyase activating enzyme
MAISGGEPTLNRPWLVEYFRQLRRLNPGARIHLDTNAGVLTADYIDELVKAGMTDCGIDLKALRLDTFQVITGVTDKRLARTYLRTEWQAARYVINNYSDRVFVGLGIPYNRDLISLKEVVAMGEKICQIDPSVQVCLLDYRPEFRRIDIDRPSYEEMVAVHRAVCAVGLRTVIAQTMWGHIDPTGRLRS